MSPSLLDLTLTTRTSSLSPFSSTSPIFSDSLTNTHKIYGPRPMLTLRCSTAERRINTNPISHTLVPCGGLKVVIVSIKLGLIGGLNFEPRHVRRRGELRVDTPVSLCYFSRDGALCVSVQSFCSGNPRRLPHPKGGLTHIGHRTLARPPLVARSVGPEHSHYDREKRSTSMHTCFVQGVSFHHCQLGTASSVSVPRVGN